MSETSVEIKAETEEKSSDGQHTATVVVQFKKRSRSSNSVINARVSSTVTSAVGGSDSEEETLISTFAGANQKSIKQTDNISTVSKVTTVYESSRSAVPHAYSGDAVHTSDIDTATDRGKHSSPNNLLSRIR